MKKLQHLNNCIYSYLSCNNLCPYHQAWSDIGGTGYSQSCFGSCLRSRTYYSITFDLTAAVENTFSWQNEVKCFINNNNVIVTINKYCVVSNNSCNANTVTTEFFMSICWHKIYSRNSLSPLRNELIISRLR